MNTKEQEQAQIRLAKAFQDLLVDLDVKGIKELSFNGSFYFIRFKTKKEALAANGNKYLKSFEYRLISEMFKYRHELVGLIDNVFKK